MDEYTVVIVGAGPVGMVLAGELALAGVEVALLERRPTQQLAGSRAGGLQSRTIEEFDQRGIAERFLAAGTTAQVQRFGDVTLDISDFPTRHPYGLALWQNQIEGILAEWIGELGVVIQYGCEVTGVEQNEAGVTVRLAGGSGDRADENGGRGHCAAGTSLRARYVVGCDGGRSLVRRAAGIGFAGWDATVSNLVAEVEYGVEPEWGMKQGSGGSHGIGRIGPETDTMRVVVTESELRRGAAEPTLAELSEAMIAVWGTDFGVHSPTWISRFTDAARQATTYRAGRILLAGDAAHVHYPAGGQGLNIGVQDATNLGWKLAQVVAGVSPSALLDTYDAERRPVAARVLRDTLAQVGLRRADERSKAVTEAIAELLSLDEGRRRFGARLSGLGVHYEFATDASGDPVSGDRGRATEGVALADSAAGTGATGSSAPGDGVHALVGRRMPDLPLVVADVARQTFELLHEARPVLLDLGMTISVDSVGAWLNRVRVVKATCTGVWELPEIGVVEPPSAVLVRPDGYVVWVGDGTASGLEAALARWFGDA